MTIWVGRFPGTAPWYNSGMGVAPRNVKVWTGITSSILAQMGHMRSPKLSTWNVDDDGVVRCYHQGSYAGVMVFWCCWGLPTPAAMGKCLLGPNSWCRDKKFLDSGVGALPRVLEAYMGEVWPAKPTWGRMARPPWPLAQCGGHSCLVWFGLL